MASLILSARDIEFLLYEWLDVLDLTRRPEFAEHSRQTFDDVLALAEQVASKCFASHNRAADLQEPVVATDGTVRLIPEVRQALDAFYGADLQLGPFPAEFGGAQLPISVARAVAVWFQAANPSTATYPFMSMANANLLIHHGSAEQIARYAQPIIEGRFFGTMALSEPQAGSSLADITTRAKRQPDGSYRLSGTKMWISCGEHELGENIVHLVLARVAGAPAGVQGISLFIVAKYLVDDAARCGERNDVTLVGLNHKMGSRGTSNTLLSFGEGSHRPNGAPGAVGYLIGTENQGLANMFFMMNEARIGVGLGATGLGYTGYLHSLAYAKSRTQGRRLTDRDPTTPQVPLTDHPDVRRMLLAQKAYVEGGLALGLYCSKLVDECDTAPDPTVRARAATLLSVLTPVAKAWPSQWCLAANDLAIQVHGGYGYTRDFPVEQFYRDNRVNPIHEGTNGIQALDLLGRKVTAHGGAGLDQLLDAMAETTQRATADRGIDPRYANDLDTAAQQIAAVTKTLWAAGDPSATLANAAVYLEAFGHTVVAWLWLEQLLAVGDKRGAFYDGKRAAVRYFFRYELPRTRPQWDLLASMDTTTLDLDVDQL